MSELTKPFQATANLTGMRFLPTYKIHGARFLNNEQIQESAEALVQHLNKTYEFFMTGGISKDYDSLI